jgi:tetratricopeptide (TPR) repeat protein
VAGREVRPPAKRTRRAPLPGPVVEELVDGAGARRAPSLERRLGDAVRAYEADRYRDALKVLKPLAELTPDASAVRELHGLTLYRMGRWKAALTELEAYHRLTGSVDQYPVMADCERALRHPARVAELWEDLRQSSPSAEVLIEGRIVMAGSLADQDDIAGAIALLEYAGVARARPQEHHLRVWYALADLYERAGDVPRARELFRRILSHRPEFHDAAERLAML